MADADPEPDLPPAGGPPPLTPPPYAWTEAAYRRCRERGYTALAATLLDLKPAFKGSGDRTVWTSDLDVPLGVRKAWARSHDRTVLLRRLSDPAPEVLIVLLDNPRLLEAEVVRLAARRPMDPRLAPHLLRARRFRGRRAIAAAVAINPSAPPRVAAAALPLLPSQDRAQVAEAPSVHPLVRAAARSIRRPAP